MQRRKNQSSPLHDELRAVFDKAKLPTNPATAAQILHLVRDPNSNAEQFADVIRTDAALAARLLKLANSALFGQRTPTTTIQRAVTVLGLRRIRMVAVGFQLVAHLDRLGGCPFDLKTFWQRSVLRACLAREIAGKVVPRYAEEAFLIGLLQDSGILLLVQMFGAEYADLYASRNLSPTTFYAAEREHYRHDHVKAISAMAGEWKLPDSIATPLSEHHRPVRLGKKSNHIKRLSAVSYFVGSMRWTDEQAVAASEPQLHEYAQAELAMDSDALEACFNRAGMAYRRVAYLFGDALPDDLDVTDLLDEANRQLSRAASESEVRARRVEEERDQFSEERATLASAVAQYRERAARDPLTGLLNRGALADATVECIRDAQDQGIPITVLFLDIDNFKRLNDEFGHQTGDEVLKAVAVTANNAVSNAGFAGRYGGEEIVVIVPGLTEDQARQRARGLVEAVRQTDFAGLGLLGPVTCSLGAVWGRPDSTTAPETLFSAADELMYCAKRSGKDRSVFRSLEAPDAVSSGAPNAPAADALAAAIAAQAQSCEHEPPVLEDFQRIAAKLSHQRPKRFINARKQQRHQLLAPCVLSFLSGPSLEVRSENAYLRNISSGGIGLLVAHPMVRGDLVEIALSHGERTLHVAGLVAFSRHVEQTIHEIGVQLAEHARQPIFASDPAAAIQELDWVAQAVREKYGASIDVRRSA